jgi:flavin reductase (DIM6/NTAB) family NADH-FMN oxidoreductase RutF
MLPQLATGNPIAMPEQPLVLSDAFRAAMRNLAGAVSVVATQHGGERTGCTVSSVVSLSVTPPTLIVLLGRDSSTARLVARSRRFGVSLLGESAREVAVGLSGGPTKGEERFRHGRWTTLVLDGSPVAEGALVAFECEVEEMIARHTHMIVVGRVLAIADKLEDERPLLYWQRDYRQLA